MHLDFDWIANRRLVFNVLITAGLLSSVPMIPLMFSTGWKTWFPTYIGTVLAGLAQRLLKTPTAIDRETKLESGDLVGDRKRDSETVLLPPTMPESKRPE
jgi:hypothetical protein